MQTVQYGVQSVLGACSRYSGGGESSSVRRRAKREEQWGQVNRPCGGDERRGSERGRVKARAGERQKEEREREAAESVQRPIIRCAAPQSGSCSMFLTASLVVTGRERRQCTFLRLFVSSVDQVQSVIQDGARLGPAIYFPIIFFRFSFFYQLIVISFSSDIVDAASFLLFTCPERQTQLDRHSTLGHFFRSSNVYRERSYVTVDVRASWKSRKGRYLCPSRRTWRTVESVRRKPAKHARKEEEETQWLAGVVLQQKRASASQRVGYSVRQSIIQSVPVLRFETFSLCLFILAQSSSMVAI